MITSIHTIKQQFDRVISHSQEFSKVDSTTLFDRWYEAKKPFIDAWGGKLIYEAPVPVTFELSKEEKENRLRNFIEIIENQFNNYPLAEFIYNNMDDFFANQLSKDVCDYGVKIPKGSKMVKSFKYFESSPRALEDLQTQASMIIQEDKIHGTLCFSVHPLDFISSSENTYHWRSCHALDGEYRNGNLSYMLDSCTIICYLRGEKEQKLPNFPEDVLWNSKKWRMLLFIADERNAMMAGRQYPFFSPTALNVIQAHIINSRIVSSYDWSYWYNDCLSDFPRSGERISYGDGFFESRCICMHQRPYLMNDIITDVKDSRHFNDLLHSSCYIPYYCWAYKEKPNYHFTIGGAIPCLCCGKGVLCYTDLMFCDECFCQYGTGEDERFGYCACCDRRFMIDAGTWIESLENYICPDCYEDFGKKCEHCNDDWYASDLVYEPTEEKYLCPVCLDYYRRNNKLRARNASFYLTWDGEEWSLPF